ncbi:DNA methyltransferase [Kitasatospora sp. NPDC085464]|uniref:DNA methyltransferase n=1 Tax=Kitasatospora sp. NPDC085464 TaxID=3364063 RepID=UPI0037CB4562
MTYTLHRGDALTVLKFLPDESINAVITTPPYNSGGRTSSERTSRGVRAKYVTSGSGSAHDLKPFPGENCLRVTQKPVEIMQQLVQICPEGGAVLAPFTGSGSTGVAAFREGRQFHGVELGLRHADIVEQRLRAELTKDDFVLAGPEA